MGNGTDPLGTRSGTDRAAFDCGGWGCEYDPHRVYGASEDNDCHRSDVAPIRSAPVAVAEKVEPRLFGREAGERAARVVGRAAPLRRGAPGRPVGSGGAARRRADDRADRRRQQRRLRRAGRRLRSRLGPQLTCGARLLSRRGAGRLESALPAMAAGLRGALRDVRAVMVGAGHRRSDYRLVVMGYASPFRPGRPSSATPKTAGAASPRVGARSGTPTPIGRRAGRPRRLTR